MKVAIKTPYQKFVIVFDNNRATFADLKQKVFEHTKSAEWTYKFGYPPSEVLIENENVLLTNIGVSSGDTIVLEPLPQSSSLKHDTIPSSIAISNNFVKSIDIVVKEIPDDNSCLFSSIIFVLSLSTTPASLRSLICDTIHADPLTYSSAFLGQSPQDYCRWIMQPNSWGGAIELSILSNHFAVELASIDIQTLRIDIFGSERNYFCRSYILYSGIHYDAIYDQKSGRRKFDPKDDDVLTETLKLAAIKQASHQYTNTTTFQLRCVICGIGVKGQREAHAHAESTGHIDFTEYM